MSANKLNALSAAMAALLATNQASAAVLEEVTVTAQKKQETLQTVPIAISAFSGEMIDNAGIQDVIDLQSMVPSLQVSTYNGGARVFIRGIGLVSFAPGAEPSVAYHVDGAVVAQPAAQVGTYYDIERIEVMRGPQGSLYGRNATGGNINVITRRPDAEFGGNLNLTGGNHELLQADGMLTGPLVNDQLLGRVAFSAVDRDGYGTNLFNDEPVDNQEAQSIRTSLSYVGSENFDAFLTYTHNKEDDANYVIHAFGPGNPNVKPTEVAQGGVLAPDPRDFNTELVPSNNKELDSVTLELTWSLSDSLSLKSLSNYLDYKSDTVTDLGATAVQFLGSTAVQESEHYSQELQLTWEGEKHSTLFGLYYFNEDYHSDVQILGPPVFTNVLKRPFVNFYGDLTSDSYAAYWNTTWRFNSQWALKGGLRYSADSKDDQGFQQLPTGAPTDLARDDNWDAWTPTTTLEYTPSDELMFYATISRGYKTGVINVGTTGDPVDPEYILNYEIGMKSQWWDQRLQVNTAVFYDTIDDLQVQRPENGTLITLNAAEAETSGIEFEGIALLTDALTANLNLAYVNAEFVDFETANPTTAPGTQVNLKGNPLPNAPEVQADLSLEYAWDMTDNWSVNARLQGVYTDERWFNEFQEAISYQDDTFSTNANILIASGDGHWTLNLWGRNLTDEDIITHVNVGSATLGFLRVGTFYDPRTYGATLGYTF